MSTKATIKFKKVKPTAAENTFKQRYDETRWLLEHMGKDPNAPGDKSRQFLNKKNSESFRKHSRLSGSHEPYQRHRSTDHIANEDGSNYSVNMQTNITINQILLNQGETIGTKSTAVMNDNMEDMLNRELILQNQRTLDQNKKKRVGNSLTSKIYHADDRATRLGKVTFKPLAMETVVENAAEDQATKKQGQDQQWRRDLLRDYQKNLSAGNLQLPRTTEQNISLQQRLDFSTAEDFVSFPKTTQITIMDQGGANGSEYADHKRIRNREGSVSRGTQPRKMLYAGSGGAKLKAAPVKLKKQIMPPERLQHPGLQHMQQRIKQLVASTEPKIRTKEMLPPSGHRSPKPPQTRGQSIDGLSKLSPGGPGQQYNPLNRSETSAKLRSPGQHASVSPPRSREVAGLPSSNRKDQAATTLALMAEKTNSYKDQPVVVPPMPHRLRSNLTFQPKGIKPNFEIKHDTVSQLEKDRQSVDDRLSRVAKDYKMAVKNKERMALLMDILSNDDQESSGHFINLLNDARSNDDAQSNENRSTRLPNIKRKGEIESGQAEMETGIVSTAFDKSDARSFHALKKSIDGTQFENKSMNQSFLSHEPNVVGEKNYLVPTKNRYKTKITSQSQISGGRDNIGQPFIARFAHKSPQRSGNRNPQQPGRLVANSHPYIKQWKSKYQSVMASQTYGDPNDSFDDTMTAPSVRLNNRIQGTRFSDGMSDQFEYIAKGDKGRQREMKFRSPANNKHQNLHFNAGLTYVMKNGKVQPSQQYIIDSMLPYANIEYRAKHNQITNQQKAVLIASSNNYPGQSGQSGAQLLKAKKAKKVKKGIQGPPQKGKKGVIMEEDIEDDDDVPLHKVATWQDIQAENQQLKTQILNQIAIFQQYLKVAVLANENRIREEADSMQKRGKRANSQLTIFESNREFADSLMSSIKKRQNKTPNKIAGSSTLFQGNNYSRSLSKKKYGSRSSANLLQQNRAPSARSQKSNNSARSARSGRSGRSRRSSARGRSALHTEGSAEREKPSKFDQFKTGAMNVLKKITNAHKIVSYDPRRFENLGGDVTQAQMIGRIQRTWDSLDEYNNAECNLYEDKIKVNKKRIQLLTRENLFEIDVNTNDQKLLLKVQDARTAKGQKLKQSREEKMVQVLQKRLREEITKNEEYGCWGFHNHIIEYKIKCRMTEDIIDLAQRVQIKQDGKLVRQMELMRRLRDQTWEDLRFFVIEREKRPWRNWDKHGYNFKPELFDRKKVLSDIYTNIDSCLMQISLIEPKFKTMIMIDIPPYNCINAEMIQFCTDAFGNEGWLQLFSLKMHRKRQAESTASYVADNPVLNALGSTLKQKVQNLRDVSNRDSVKLSTGYEKVIQEKQALEAIKQADSALEQSLFNTQEGMGGKNMPDGPFNNDQLRLAGDVVAQIKARVDKRDQEMQDKIYEKERAQSKWIRTLEREKEAREQKQAQERAARAARLAKLFDEEENSMDDDDRLDLEAADRGMLDYLGKIDQHLEVEKQILSAWGEQDKEGKETPQERQDEAQQDEAHQDEAQQDEAQHEQQIEETPGYETQKSQSIQESDKVEKEEVAGIPFNDLVGKLNDSSFDRKAFQESLSKEDRKKLILMAKKVKEAQTEADEQHVENEQAQNRPEIHRT